MSYWERRQEETYKAGEMTVNQYFKGLEKSFNQAKQELQKTVESFYWRYAEENGLTYAAAQKRLDKKELKSLRDFVDKAMKNIGKYNQDVNNMSIKARMTRYQALEAQVDAILRELYAVDYQADAEEMMSGLYQETYHRTWYDADRYRGFHAQFAQIEPRTMETVLKYPFNGANFSDRLWKQKEHLQSQLMESITTMMVQGTSPQNLAKDFAKKMQAKKFDAYRLLHTEGSYVMSEATHAGYKEDGVEQYQILATPNLNGDYISDALAAQVGGLGLAPGVNMSDSLAFYEATHGTAPTIAGQDKANPGSVILCGALMLEQMGVPAAAERIRNAMSKAIAGRAVTVDLAAQVEGARVVGCQEFGEIIGACL